MARLLWLNVMLHECARAKRRANPMSAVIVQTIVVGRLPAAKDAAAAIVVVEPVVVADLVLVVVAMVQAGVGLGVVSITNQTLAVVNMSWVNRARNFGGYLRYKSKYKIESADSYSPPTIRRCAHRAT